MANLAKLLKDEIQRLAKKETRIAMQGLQKQVTGLRRTISQQKKRIDALEAGRGRAAQPRAVKSAKAAAASEAPAAEADRIRPTGKMIRNMRAKLGLTQAEFAQLLGVSGQSVYQWESKDGRLQLRSKARQALAEARTLGKREAQKRLEASA